MTQCLNPDCLTQNLETHRFCQSCGRPLWLKDRYQALNLIGQGGFGKTFLAIDHDKPSKPSCVIKQFFPQLSGTEGLAKAEELFAEEAKRLDELGHHDQIPSLLAYFSLDSRQYLVQEYIEGQNLEVELEQLDVFSQDKIEKLLQDLLLVLDFIHQVPVIHRDIKPENIIRRSRDQKLVLVDFGASKLMTSQNRSITGTVIGTAEYVAPEQINGKATPASDLYSLGVTCLRLLTGLSPSDLFDSGEFEWIWREKLGNNSVGNDFADFLEKLISPGTRKRYQTATETLESLVKINRNSSQNTSFLNSISTIKFDIEDIEKSQIFSRLQHIISEQLEIAVEKIDLNTKIFEISRNSQEANSSSSKGSIWGFFNISSSGSTKLFSGDNEVIIANNWGDALDTIELVVSIEEEFDLEIPDEILEKVDTVDKIVEYIFNHKNGQ